MTRRRGPGRPVEQGNQLAVRHGAHASTLVSERAEALLSELRQQYPWLEGVDAPALDVLVAAKCRHDLLADYISDVIDGTRPAYPRKGFPGTGVEAVPDRVWQQLSREARTVLDASSKLGFTPTERAQLLRDVGVARHYGADRIAALVERGRQVREAGA